MSRIQTLIVLLIAVTIVGLVACSSKSNDTNAPTISDSTTSADPEDDRPGEGIAVGEPAPGFSPVSMPLRKLTFSVQTPNNTPENAPVYLSIVDLIGGVDKHIRMKNLGNGVYETQAEVTEGAMVRYNYDRFDGEGCCDAYVTREAIGQIFEMQYRLLLVEQDLDRVDDTIATWADLRVSHDEGTITGQVLDLETGEPVFDADVSISGIHVGTRVDGSFRVEGLPPGNHRVVVHSDTGDFLPQQAFISFGPATKEVRGDFLIEKTPLVPVTFDVQLPDSTPDDAWIKLAGNISSLGARIAHPSRPLIPDNFFIPRIERNGNTASAEFMLPEGAFIEYFYVIGPIGLTQDRGENGQWVYRNFTVGEGGDRRSDRVEAWTNKGWPLTKLRLVPPVGTPIDTPIVINIGPASWMEPRTDGTYSTVIGSYPPGGLFQYRYLLGDDFNGLDASPETEDGFRTLAIPEKSSIVTDTVTRWIGQSDPTARDENGGLSVTFRVSVPPETPFNSRVYLHGNRPAIGDRVEMKPLDSNPWIYEAEVQFDHDGRLAYFFGIGEDGLETFAREVDTSFDGQLVNDWVAVWPGISRSVSQRENFVKGIYTPDFFSNGFIALSESTYERILDHEGSAVVVSSVWSYGQTQPVPTLEFRAVNAGSVATPLEDAIEQSRIAHEAGLEVFFGPQFNMEQAPGGFEVYNEPKTDEWWLDWLKLADEMWTWQATVAEMVGAEYMMVPGPLFHVYEYIDKPADDPFIANFEAEQARLMAKIRGIYSGKLIVSGGNKNYDFPGLADFNGVTTYDVGVPQLPAGTSVSEFVDYYEDRFMERVDPIFEKWGNPVFFYTIHAPGVPAPGDPAGEITQANAIEAIFQVISERPFINGSLSWSYDMIDAPLIASDGVRGKLAEAVLAKWYAILGGEN